MSCCNEEEEKGAGSGGGDLLLLDILSSRNQQHEDDADQLSPQPCGNGVDSNCTDGSVVSGSQVAGGIHLGEPTDNSGGLTTTTTDDDEKEKPIPFTTQQQQSPESETNTEDVKVDASDEVSQQSSNEDDTSLYHDDYNSEEKESNDDDDQPIITPYVRMVESKEALADQLQSEFQDFEDQMASLEKECAFMCIGSRSCSQSFQDLQMDASSRTQQHHREMYESTGDAVHKAYAELYDAVPMHTVQRMRDALLEVPEVRDR